MHTQQGKGKRDWRQFSKNNTAQVSRVCPLAHPAEAQSYPNGRPGASAEVGSPQDAGGPRRLQAAPAAAPSRFPFPVNLPGPERRLSLRAWTEVAPGHPKSDDAARPAQPGAATGGAAPGEAATRAGSSREPGLPLRLSLPRGLRWARSAPPPRLPPARLPGRGLPMAPTVLLPLNLGI